MPAAPFLQPGDECPGGETKSQAAVPYDLSSWAQTGEAIAVSILDLYGHNCCSRLPGSRYGSLARLLSLSPSFNSHRGGTYAGVFGQQLPCQRSECCWHRGAPPVSSPALPGSAQLPAGNSTVQNGGSLSSTAPLSSHNDKPPMPRGEAARRSVPFPEKAPNLSGRPPPLGPGGKPSHCGASCKPDAPGSRRQRRAAAAAIPPPQPASLQAGIDRTGLACARSTAPSNKGASEQKSSRSSVHRQRATRTASTGALIVASGARSGFSSSAQAPWSSHR